MPLQKGNYWEYDYFLADQTVPIDSARWEVAEELRFTDDVGTRSIFGLHWYNLEREPPDGITLFSVDASGFWNEGVASDGDTLYQRSLEIPYPAEIGEGGGRFTYSFLNGAWSVSDTISVTLVSTDTEVSTPAGTFSAWVYKWVIDPPSIETVFRAAVFDYYVPNTGYIGRKFTDVEDTTGVKAQWLLRRFCL